MAKLPLGLIVKIDAWFIYILEWFCEFILVLILVDAVLGIITVLPNCYVLGCEFET